MKVAVNVLSLKSGHRFRGMGSYTKNLLDSLREYTKLEIIEFEKYSDIKKVDLVHYPFFDLFYKSLPLFKRIPTVVTIGDVTPLVFPEHYPPGIKGSINNKYQKLSLKNVRAIITFSRHSKLDIEKYLGINSNKIYPIYLVQNEIFKKCTKNELDVVKKRFHLPDKFALFVGSVNWNKNLLNMTKACLDAKIDLVLVGKSFEEKSNLNHPELKSFKIFLENYSNNPNIHILGYVSNQNLVALYNLATVTLLPSFYEGFGLTILESQACQTPVITSNVSSMPEVAGDGALLINPNKIDEISTAIKKITVDNSLREKLVKKGIENIKRFSLEKVARETEKVYEKATPV